MHPRAGITRSLESAAETLLLDRFGSEFVVRFFRGEAGMWARVERGERAESIAVEWPSDYSLRQGGEIVAMLRQIEACARGLAQAEWGGDS